METVSKEEWDHNCDHVQTNEVRYRRNKVFLDERQETVVTAAVTTEVRNIDSGYETYGLSPTSGIIPLNTDTDTNSDGD
jgi:hypothetical protein